MKLDLDPDKWAPRKTVAPPVGRSLTYAEQTVMGVLKRRLQEQADKVAGSLTQGTLITIEQYREAVGELRGISFGMNAIREAENEASGIGEAVEKQEPLYGV